MTYKQLAEEISQMTPEQQSNDVTVFVTDEYYRISCVSYATEAIDVLDNGHPILSPE